MLKKLARILVALAIIALTFVWALPVHFVSALPAWWDTDWLYRQKITFTNSASADNLINFPVLVAPAAANDVYIKALANGYDLRFLDSDNSTSLDYERVSFDTTAKTAEIWVNVPQVDSGSDADYIWMYYGNAAASDGQNIAATWNSGYQAVYHMNDASTTTISDSTINANTGTKKGVNEPIEVAGLVGKAQSFDGTNDYINLGHSSVLSITEELTIETSLTTTASWRLFVDKGRGNSYGFGVAGSNGNKLRIEVGIGGTYVVLDSDEDINDGLPQRYAITYTQIGTPTLSLFIGGVIVKSTTAYSGDIGATALDLIIGAGYGLDANMLGVFDELRISNISRSASWIAATNLNITNTYATYGSLAGKPLSPTNLTATVNGNNIDLAWAKGTLADTTYIVRGQSAYPTTITDGTVVYTSSASAYSDVGIGSDATQYYYSAWSVSDWGYSASYIEATAGGTGMTLIANSILFILFVTLALIFMILARIFKEKAWCYISIPLWLIAGGFPRLSSSISVALGAGLSDIIFVICAAMAVLAIIEIMTLNKSMKEINDSYDFGEGIETDEESEAELQSLKVAIQSNREQMNILGTPAKREKGMSKREAKQFNRTGIIHHFGERFSK